MCKPKNTFLEGLEASMGDLDKDFDTQATAPADNAPADMRGRLTTVESVKRYIFAGKATLTVVSEKTGNRFSYRISAAESGDTYFVGLLTGADNESDYKYLGRISRGIFWIGRKNPRPGDIGPDAPSAKAFDYVWRALARGDMPAQCEIWHESHCGRCGRKLTVPSSVSQGFGPECINKIGQ